MHSKNETISNNNLSSSDVNNVTIQEYLFLFRIHYKKIIITMLTGILLSLYFIYATPPSYTATATIVVRDKPGANMIMDIGGTRERNRIENQIQLIKSRTVAKAVINKIWDMKKNGLDLFDSNPFYPRGRRIRQAVKEIITFGMYDPLNDSPAYYTEEYTDEIGERFASRLLNGITIRPRTNSDIIDVSYTSIWPLESKLIINTIADTYKSFDEKLSSEKASNSVYFLEKLVQDQEMALINSEKEITEFKKMERMYNLDGPAIDITSQIASIETEIYGTNSEIKIKEEKYNILKSKLSEDEKSFADKIMNTINSQVISIRKDISDLEAQLIKNIALYGENHSAIESIKSKIKLLKIQMNSKVNELTNQGIIADDPLKTRQDMIAELISLDNDIMALDLKRKQSRELMTIFENKLNKLPPKQIEFSRLERNNIVLNQNYSLLRQKLEEARINLASQVGKVQIVDYARLPNISVQNHKRTLLMGLFLGLGLGMIVAISIEYIDNTIKTSYDIEKNDLMVLGVIPSIGMENQSKKTSIFDFFINPKRRSNQGLKRRLITREDPRSPVSEAYRSLRTSMLYTGIDSETKSILVSSAGPGEGKTTTVANMAITYANLGKKTLLVDTDLRRPVVHKVFGLDKEPGITNYLAGNVNDFNSLVKHTDIDNLYAVTSGIIPPNPSELLGSNKMGKLIKDLESKWDVVLFDSPPLVAVTDATMVSKEIDKIIIVVKVGQTDKRAFNHTIQSLRNVNAPLGGVVLNAVTHKNSYGSYYYYYQYYHYYGNSKEKI